MTKDVDSCENQTLEDIVMQDLCSLYYHDLHST